MSAPQSTSFKNNMIRFLASRRFFILVVCFLVFESVWIALSGRYPMAFDENFHLGIIQLYADHLNPFWSGQPADADAFGAVARDPSYLYHWLMSFPYQVISFFTANETAQVLTLRFLNIGLFVSTLPLYRRLLLKTGASNALTHSCLALFVLIPIVPLLAAQINYDNLFLPLTALALLLTVNFGEELKTQRFNVRQFVLILITLLLACLVKYAFLPIALVTGAYLVTRCCQTYSSWRKFRQSIGFGLSLITRRTAWLLIIGLVLATGLFLQRYGINVVRYHKPVPDCAQILSVRQCSAYSPWVRDHILAANKDDNASSSPAVFTADWFYGMWLRSFFAVDGPATNFQTRGPFVLPAFGAIIFGSIGLLAAIGYGKRLLRRYNAHVLWLFVAIVTGYAAVLWLDGYQSFLQTGRPVAINGRYLLPAMPLLILLCALGWNELLRRHQSLKMAVFSVALLCMLWGGGALTYVLRSNDAWYWQNQTVVSNTNQAVQRVLGPLTPGYRHPTAFMGWN